MEGSAVEEEDVQAAVAVVVEEGAAGAHRLGHILAAEAAVGVTETDAGALGDVFEPRSSGAQTRVRGACASCPCTWESGHTTGLASCRRQRSHNQQNGKGR